MTHVDRLFQIQRRHQLGEVVGIGVQIVTVRGLTGAAMASPVVRDAPVSTSGQEHHLIFKCVGAQRPAVTEDNGLARPPILVVDLRPVFGRKCGINILPS